MHNADSLPWPKRLLERLSGGQGFFASGAEYNGGRATARGSMGSLNVPLH
jgi:hypothetical protein